MGNTNCGCSRKVGGKRVKRGGMSCNKTRKHKHNKKGGSGCHKKHRVNKKSKSKKGGCRNRKKLQGDFFDILRYIKYSRSY